LTRFVAQRGAADVGRREAVTTRICTKAEASNDCRYRWHGQQEIVVVDESIRGPRVEHHLALEGRAVS